MDIYLEIFGYIGTALVLLSMMMTSVARLRIVNISGSVVSMTYAALSNTWPVVFLNFGLIIINSIQLVRLHKLKSRLVAIPTNTCEASVRYFLEHYSNDIAQYFPDFAHSDNDLAQVFVVYDGAEAVGILIGERQGEVLCVKLDYVSTKYRDRSIAKFLFEHIKEYGITTLLASTSVEKHKKYLMKMDFKDQGDTLVKIL